jgi:glucose/arabinose dehydrogenase
VEGLEARLCLSGYLLVSGFDSNSVLRYNESMGVFVDAVVPSQSGGLREPKGVVQGPDHNVYVASGLKPNQILRYNGSTGAFLGNFADDNQVTSLRAILYGPDGNLYVADGNNSSSVACYDGTTGAFLDEFGLPNSSDG